MKKIIGAFLVFCTVLCSGCGTNAQNAKETLSMYDLRQAMTAADESLPEMLVASSSDEDPDELFSYVSDMDYDKVDAFFLSYSKEGKADEIAVIAVKDLQDLEEAKKSLEAHRERRHQLFEQYEPQEVKRIDDGIIFAEQQYAVLIICDNNNAVRSAFEKMTE